MKSLNNNVHCLLIFEKTIYTIFVDCFLEPDSLKNNPQFGFFCFFMFSQFWDNITRLDLNERQAIFFFGNGSALSSTEIRMEYILFGNVVHNNIHTYMIHTYIYIQTISKHFGFNN